MRVQGWLAVDREEALRLLQNSRIKIDKMDEKLIDSH